VLFNSKGEGNMEVIKFNDFLDGSYKLLPLESQSVREKVIEMVMMLVVAGLCIEFLPQFIHIVTEVMGR
jgi:hypothetical protein